MDWIQRIGGGGGDSELLFILCLMDVDPRTVAGSSNLGGGGEELSKAQDNCVSLGMGGTRWYEYPPTPNACAQGPWRVLIRHYLQTGTGGCKSFGELFEAGLLKK